MIAGDRLEFAQAFNRLAVATRLPTGEADAAMQQVYWSGLEDIPVDYVTTAAESIAKSSVWFPKLAEWREASFKVRLEGLIQLPAGREEPWHHECETCMDTCWELLQCYPGSGKNCGRRRCVRGGAGTYEHVYAVRCSCHQVNRTYQRQHGAHASRVIHRN